MKLKLPALLLLAATPIIEAGVTDVPLIVILDDNTGQEIRDLHGIEPLVPSDLNPLIGVGAFNLHHIWIDGEGLDNPVASLKLIAPSVASPSPPTRGGRLAAMARKLAEYENQAALSKKAVRLNADQNRRAIEKFFERVQSNRARSEKEFRDHMASRGSQDYPRSDILGAIAVSASLMGQDYPDYIVFNSDLDHRPTRTETPPQTLKIHPETVVILVNQSLLPERSPLIAGIPNEVLHASSLAEAFAAIAERESLS